MVSGGLHLFCRVGTDNLVIETAFKAACMAYRARERGDGADFTKEEMGKSFYLARSASLPDYFPRRVVYGEQGTRKPGTRDTQLQIRLPWPSIRELECYAEQGDPQGMYILLISQRIRSDGRFSRG